MTQDFSQGDQDDDSDDAQDEFQTNPGDINPLYELKRDESLPEDFSTPFSPPEGEIDHIDDTYPQTDTNIDETEHYNEGIEGAAEADVLSEGDDLPPEK